MTHHDAFRRAAQYRAGAEKPADEDTERSSGRDRRPEAQVLWVDQQIRQAMARGAFDDLPYAGKPLPERVFHHDPDWWVKQLVEREKITGVLPPALQLRKDDAMLAGTLDQLGSEKQVREELESFNRRVTEARRQLLGGPPVITELRDVEAEVAAWKERAAERRRRAAEKVEEPRPQRRRRLFRRRSA